MSTKINLESGDVYLKPQFYSKDEVIANELKTYNNYLLKWLRFDMGKKHYEIIQPTDIKEWLVIGDDASVSVDKDKMSSWVEDFCLKYKTVGKTRSFKSHTGEILQVSGGDYGWQIDYSQTVDQIYNAITAESKEAGCHCLFK